ncbi:hypothetical protein NHX12_032857 [Muraenolepis orangiensis]|uniref:Uncharacterized protein n=1 Tax=Muraenolepis orangiensis TaxID=630683 RepID=A0A9Q0E0J2_9TELE|nr:hypothetical protein NHX12_032857 [Muraenolepis orangiensis]
MERSTQTLNGAAKTKKIQTDKMARQIKREKNAGILIIQPQPTQPAQSQITNININQPPPQAQWQPPPQAQWQPPAPNQAQWQPPAPDQAQWQPPQPQYPVTAAPMAKGSVAEPHPPPPAYS